MLNKSTPLRVSLWSTNVYLLVQYIRSTAPQVVSGDTAMKDQR